MRAFNGLVLFSLFSVLAGLAQSSSPPGSGTRFTAYMSRSIRASHARPGDTIDLKVAQSFLFNGTVVPAGARISGHVVVARKADKKTKLGSLLSLVADTVSWKKGSVRLSAWIVGFGSIKFAKSDVRQSAGMKVNRRMLERMTETTDRPKPKYSDMPVGPEVFTTYDPSAGSTKYDSGGVVRHFRLVRMPQKSIGTLLLHDDGDVYLPKGLLVLMEQIEVDDNGTSAVEEAR